MAKEQIDWRKVRAEWEAGMLPLREIARQCNCSEGAIRKKAKAEAWPDRRAPDEQVRKVVRTLNEYAPPDPELRTSLAVFDRVISLMMRHRKFLNGLHDQWAMCIQDALDYRQRRIEAGRPLTLKEAHLMADLLQKATGAISKLVPLERQAFGLSDQDGPSEFDVLTAEELEGLDGHVKRALGLPD
ncbi:hypothetical protein EON81_06905 [bacterium]|nr:MAG: hypothetical protein EON81_06905 [bacterium]